MRPHTLAGRHTTTPYILLNTHLCQACWKCIEACPQGVIVKIALPFHKHARIGDTGNCKGCLACAKVCPNGAIIALNNRTIGDI